MAEPWTDPSVFLAVGLGVAIVVIVILITRKEKRPDYSRDMRDVRSMVTYGPRRYHEAPKPASTPPIKPIYYQPKRAEYKPAKKEPEYPPFMISEIETMDSGPIIQESMPEAQPTEYRMDYVPDVLLAPVQYQPQEQGADYINKTEEPQPYKKTYEKKVYQKKDYKS